MHFGRHLFIFLGSLYTIAMMTLFLSVADQPLGREGYLPLSPTLTALVSLAPFFTLLLIRDLMTKGGSYILLNLRACSVPILSFFCVAATSLLLSVLPSAYWEEGGKWIFLISYGFTISIFATFVPLLVPRFHKLLPIIGAISLSLLLWSVVKDFTSPGTFTPIDQRAAGFPGNANFCALVAVMTCAACLEYTRDNATWRNSLFLLITGVIITASMSRSGALNFLFLVGTFTYLRLSRINATPQQIARLAGSSLFFTVCCVGVVCTLTLFSDLVPKGSRLHRLLNNQQVDDGSAGSRLFAVKESLRLIDESPLLGHGTGFSRTMKELPHNLYLQQWVNNGVAGVCALAFFFATSLIFFTKRKFRPGQAFILVAMLGGVFSHNVLDQRAFLLLYGSLLGLSHQRNPASAQ